MVCIHCGGKTRVVNSRHQQKSNQVWRRRRCLECDAVFSTEEAARHELAWLVRHNSRLEPFQREKLFISVYRSCQHRPAALSDARDLTETILGKLRRRVTGGTLKSTDIASVVQVALSRFDKAASVYYRAYHKT